MPRLTTPTLRTLALIAGAGALVAGLSLYDASSAAPAPGSPGLFTAPAALHATGPWFTGSDGKVVVLHGTNMINKFAPYTPEALGFGADDLTFLADNGFNGIRLGLTWSAVEPRPGEYDDAYIDKIVALATDAQRYGIVPVVDFHQDGYSERYGGNGAPGWATIDYGLPVLPLPGLIRAVGAGTFAIQNFWKNTPASDGIGLQDHYAAAWKHVAQRFASNTGAAFELANEPYPWQPDVAFCALPLGCKNFDTQVLAAFYAKVLKAVRQVEPDRLVFVEPNVFFGLPQARTWLPRTQDAHTAFAFHDYCAVGLAGALSPQAVCDAQTDLGLANAQAHFDTTGETNLMDEFGAFMSDASVEHQLQQSDRMMLSWMHWAYWGQDFGESATYGLINDIAKAPESDNIKQGLLTVLTRPSPRIVAGTPQSWSWDAATSTFRARYTTARADGLGSFSTGATSEFFVHPRFFPHGYQVQVTGGSVTSAPNAARLRIAAAPGTDQVAITVTALP